MSGGYHLTEIPKGVLGELSKVLEEVCEFEDARRQGSKIMMAVELSDVYGALLAYMNNYPSDQYDNELINTLTHFIAIESAALGLHVWDLMKFNEITARAFKVGER